MDAIFTELPSGLALKRVECCVCNHSHATPVAVGKDFEYKTSDDSFLAFECRNCGLIYLNPRPADTEFARIYPDTYHAFAFSESSFGFVYTVRRKLEARRLLGLCRDLPANARILDVGCGDGFHLDLLREFGPASWRLEGVDVDERAAEMAADRGLTVHVGTVQSLPLDRAAYDFALMIQTIEHVGSPPDVLASVLELLKPGGRLLIVTDNTGSLDFTLFKSRHWGGYHFPRHFNLFNRQALARLAGKCGYEVEAIRTIVSPVNWTYSVRNMLDDYGAPRWLVEQFSLRTPITLGVFTIFDSLHQFFGRGALLQAVIRRPR
jgi:Methylase involved in ubiquinone/menaquinone biosynthesis